jgi:hypothetical protein
MHTGPTHTLIIPVPIKSLLEATTYTPDTTQALELSNQTEQKCRLDSRKPSVLRGTIILSSTKKEKCCQLNYDMVTSNFYFLFTERALRFIQTQIFIIYHSQAFIKRKTEVK